MTGGESYKEFDNASIVTNSTTKDSVTLGKYTFRKRDLLLGGIAIIALLGVIILVIVLAAQAGSSDSSCKNGGGQPKTSAIVSDDQLPYCVTKECLKAALYQKPIMSENVDPCDNFYSYACGQYPSHHPKSQFLSDVSPENEIVFENTRKLVYLLDDSTKNTHEHSYERKLKDFMKSCNNHFDKMDLRGTPLVTKVINKLGGWYAIGSYDNTTFDFYQLLKKIHIDYWTDAFFTLSVRTDQTNWNHKIVEFTVGGLRLDYRYFQPYPFFAPYQNVYRNYMRLIASLLSVDAGVSLNDDLIAQFAEDAYEVEAAIANILYNVQLARDSHSPDKKLTLAELQAHLNNTVNLVDYMKTLFNEWPGKFESNTKVALTITNYFDRLGSLIASHLETEEGKRKLHNYLMWQVIDRYSRDLSWDYIHAKRKLNHLLFSYKDDSSGYSYCFNIAQQTFPNALSAIYVREHIKDAGRTEAKDILTAIKKVLVNGIRNLNWMSDTDRNTAVSKIEQSLYKIGFPDQLTDEDYMDNYYYHLSIDPNDFFENNLRVNSMHRRRLNSAVGRPNSKAEWAYQVYDPVIEYFNPWSELIVTAAMLENPLFDANGPAFYNYGGIGSRMATNLIHAIDEYGSQFKTDGSHFGIWWSDVTINHYAEIKRCAINSQNEETVGPFTDFNGNLVTVNNSRFAPVWAPEMLADSSGIRMAYKAYKEMEKEKGKEKLPPGLDKLNGDKMFFVSYAQSYCRNVADYIRGGAAQAGVIPNKYRVNVAMKNIPEFQEAFGCPKPEQCLLFGK